MTNWNTTLVPVNNLISTLIIIIMYNNIRATFGELLDSSESNDPISREESWSPSNCYVYCQSRVEIRKNACSKEESVQVRSCGSLGPWYFRDYPHNISYQDIRQAGDKFWGSYEDSLISTSGHVVTLSLGHHVLAFQEPIIGGASHPLPYT